MAAETISILTLRPADRENESWSACLDGEGWTAHPSWPSSEDLGAARWLIEESSQVSILDEHARAVRERVETCEYRLWQSLVESAPASARVKLDREAPALEVHGASADQVTALSLLHSGRLGPQAIAWHRIRAGLPPDEPSRRWPLRLLVVTARPMRGYDAPYLGVACRAAAVAARLGCSFEHLYPPTRRALAAAMQEASAAGRPFTMLVFDGHGLTSDGKAVLAFESSMGVAARIGAQDFIACLGTPPPPLIVLAACRTANAPPLQQQSVSFADELARLSGSDVIAMTSNISPADAALVTEQLVEAAACGIPLGQAVSRARHRIAEAKPSSLAWSAPIWFSNREVRFKAQGGSTGPPPPGVPRHHECREIDRAFLKAPAFFLFGHPLAGKSHFLRFYGWWFETRTGAVPTLHLDARALSSPADLAFPETPDVRPRLIVVDNAEHWAERHGTVSREVWQAFFERAQANRERGTCWLFASRSALDLPDAPWLKDACTLLFGLGGAGIRDRSEAAEVAALLFERDLDEDPWLLPLLVATRGEPLMLICASAALREGTTPKACLWQIIFADPRIRDALARHGTEPADLDGIDPMLGWGFGMAYHVLACLHFPEEEWEAEPSRALAEVYAGRLAEAGERGIALSAGGAWTLSAAHALILRSARPVSTWSRVEQERFALYFSGLSNVWEWAADGQGIAEMRRVTLDQHASNASRSVPGIDAVLQNLERAYWATFLLNLPMMLAAAELAVETEQPNALAKIAVTMCQILREFDAVATNAAWLDHWSLEMGRLAECSADGMDRALDRLAEERERQQLFAGTGNFEQRWMDGFDLAKNAFDIDPEAGIDDLLRCVITALHGSEIGADDVRIEKLITALQLGQGTATNLLDTRLLEDLIPLVGGTFRLHLTMVLANTHVQRGELHEAVTQAARLLELAHDHSTYEQYMAMVTAAEVFAGCDDPRALETALSAVSLAKRLGDEKSIGSAQLQLAQAYLAAGDLEQARHHCGEAMSKSEPIAIYHQLAGLVYAKIVATQGELELAEAMLRRVEAASDASGQTNLHLMILGESALVAFRRGQSDVAETYAARLKRLAARHGATHAQGLASLILGEVQFERDAFAESLDNAERAIAMLHPKPAEGLTARAHGLLAKAAFQLDFHERACDAQAAAARAFEAHLIDPLDQAFQWAVLECYAHFANDLDLAAEAEARIRELAGDTEIRTPPQLAISAIGWHSFGYVDRAYPRARRALDDGAALPEAILPIVNAIADEAAGAESANAEQRGDPEQRQQDDQDDPAQPGSRE